MAIIIKYTYFLLVHLLQEYAFQLNAIMVIKNQILLLQTMFRQMKPEFALGIHV